MTEYNYEILSGIPTKEIITYFSRLASSNEKYKYYGDGWIVELLMLEPVVHHKIILPQTKIVFKGSKSKCQIIIEQYRKAFMRGGA